MTKPSDGNSGIIGQEYFERHRDAIFDFASSFAADWWMKALATQVVAQDPHGLSLSRVSSPNSEPLSARINGRLRRDIYDAFRSQLSQSPRFYQPMPDVFHSVSADLSLDYDRPTNLQFILQRNQVTGIVGSKWNTAVSFRPTVDDVVVSVYAGDRHVPAAKFVSDFETWRSEQTSAGYPVPRSLTHDEWMAARREAGFGPLRSDGAIAAPKMPEYKP